MMSNAAKNIMVRAIKNRIAAGEEFEEIIKSYPRLTQEDIEEIEKEL